MEKSGNDSGERYVVHMDDKFGSLALIDIDAEADAVTVPWFNQTLTTVNKALVRLGVFRGEYHWHKHDEQDEFFLVIDGELHLDVEGREAVVLQKHQGYTVPKGVVHRTRAPERCVCVMIEEAGIVPTGD
jgi:mannose-6-phosphate isomerase-like protein (cupin superfamily)